MEPNARRRQLRLIRALTLLTLFLAACGGGGDSGGVVTSPSPTATDAGQGPGKVAVVDIAFQPAEIRIKAGETVQWNWQGNLPHSVTADDGSFDSKVLQKGATFEQTFSRAGRIEYYCQVHSSAGGTAQNGVIIVE